MTRFLLSRFAQAIATLVVASLFIFLLVRLSGSPADTLISAEATSEDRDRYIERLGLDKPLHVQYAAYLGAAVHGDFGTSLRSGRPVTELVFDRLPASLRLATLGLTFAMLLSIPLGISAAVYRGRPWDHIALLIALLGQAMPGWWIGIIGILFFAVKLGWLPTSGDGDWKHYALPAVALGWHISAAITRLQRSAMLEVLDSEYVKLARLKGMPEHVVVLKHAFRNALIPVLTYMGFMYGVVIASAITTEVVFAWPGLGRLAYESVLTRDFPLLQFTVLVWTALVVGINLALDIVYAMVDPRVRLA